MEFNELIQSRRSVRSYAADRPVTPEQVTELIQATQLAATWKNSQTGRYYAAVTPEMCEKVRACLPAFNQKSSANAALIVTTFVKAVSGHTNGTPDNELGDQWGAYDLGLQNAYLLLKARDMGLDTLIMGLRDADALRAVLSIPENEQIAAVIALGTREGAPVFRPRKDVNEVLTIC